MIRGAPPHNPSAAKPVRREISSGIIIFRRGAGGGNVKFLLLYHGRGYWNFPKGKLEKEERSFQAALREVREETGLGSHDLTFVGNFKAHERFSFTRGHQKIFKIVILFLAETKEPRIRVSEEHDGYGWFTYREAQQLLRRYKENMEILKRAHAYLQHRRQRAAKSGRDQRPV